MKLLLIEDEPGLAESITAYLAGESYRCERAGTFAEAMDRVSAFDYDCILLDLMLPGGDGMLILEALKSQGRTDGVIIISAKDSPADKVKGLRLGADDYLAKPFDLGELIARVKSLIRRSKGVSSPLLKFLDIQIDTIHQTVMRDGKFIELSPTEYRIIEYLAHRPLAIVPKREILEHLYDYDWEHHSNVIEAHLSNLRRKLGHSDVRPIIETFRHRGYRLRKEES